ncbi:MAG: hypothetical protein C0614_00015 [Desulfuromonas sp.]|nr:MAG: hypothetical protein C0614_00015 [Desulfuromonas sp.]
MKRNVVRTVLAGVILTLSLFGGIASAFSGGPSLDGPPGDMAMRHQRHVEMMTDLLDLTDLQQQQIQTLYQNEQTALAVTLQQLRAGHEQMRTLLDAEAFDEAAIRSLAKSQADLKAEVIISHAKVKHQILKLLTAEQQQLAKKIEPLLKGRGKGRRHM